MLRILYLLLLCSDTFSQTCIIAKRTKKAIYVGADSKTTIIHKNEFTNEIDSSYGSICKIITMNNYNFAVIGYMANIEIEDGKKACINNTTLLDVINDFAITFSAKLSARLEEIRKENIFYFSTVSESLKPNISQTIFFGKEKDTLFTSVVQFQLKTSALEPVVIEALFLSRSLLYGGHIEEIRDTIEKKSTWRKGAIKTIIKLINIESSYHPKLVAPPIDIIKITRKKIKWIQKKQECN